MNLTMIPFHDWKKCEREGFRTRDAHFMEVFGGHSLVNRLLIINRPISFAEIALLRRNWRVKSGEPVAQRRGVYLTEVAPQTFTLDIVVADLLKPILKRRAWIPDVFGRPRTAEAISFALNRLDMEENYVLLMSAPLFAPLVNHLSPAVLALDAQDNLLKHALYRDLPHLEEYYRVLQEKADVISANSEDTASWLAKNHPHVQTIPNGVDVRAFQPDVDYPVPIDVRPLGRPIVGYAGKMQEMFDMKIMEQAVSRLPDVSFVFIGQLLDRSWVEALWRYPNAHYLGDKPYDSLPSYLSAFDICIIPYDVQRQHGGDPIKFYEYLSMGKPIVTTDIGHVAEFEDYPQVRIARDAESFVEGIYTFIDHLDSNENIEKWPVPSAYSWETRADELLKAIAEKLAR